MKKELINELWQRFEAASGTIDGVECWSARDLQVVFGYTDWRNFLPTVAKAREACTTGGERAEDHFVGVNKMVDLGSGAQRAVDDFALTRYACYLIAQNGDPAKPEIAFAQTYFAVQKADTGLPSSAFLSRLIPYFRGMATSKDMRAKREEIMRSMIASFRIEGIRITVEMAERLLKKIELRLAGSRA